MGFIVRKAEYNYYNKIKHKKMINNKIYWKTVKPFLLANELTMTAFYILMKMRPFLMRKRYQKNYLNFCRCCKRSKYTEYED